MKGVFSFGIDDNGKFFYESMTDRYETEVEPTELEAEALKYIIDAAGAVKIYRRTDAYLTICNESGNDFCRLKATERAKWFSLDMPFEYYEDERLKDVQNKNQRHWKIKLKSIEDVVKFADIIKAASLISYENPKS